MILGSMLSIFILSLWAARFFYNCLCINVVYYAQPCDRILRKPPENQELEFLRNIDSQHGVHYIKEGTVSHPKLQYCSEGELKETIYRRAFSSRQLTLRSSLTS